MIIVDTSYGMRDVMLSWCELHSAKNDGAKDFFPAFSAQENWEYWGQCIGALALH